MGKPIAQKARQRFELVRLPDKTLTRHHKTEIATATRQLRNGRGKLAGTLVELPPLIPQDHGGGKLRPVRSVKSPQVNAYRTDERPAPDVIDESLMLVVGVSAEQTRNRREESRHVELRVEEDQIGHGG